MVEITSRDWTQVSGWCRWYYQCQPEGRRSCQCLAVPRPSERRGSVCACPPIEQSGTRRASADRGRFHQGLGTSPRVGGLYADSLGLGKGVMMVGGFAALVIGILGQMFVHRRVHGDFKEVLVSRTCKFMGLEYTAGEFDFPLARFTSAGLISKDHDEANVEDRIRGEHEEVRFELCEANLKHHPKRRTTGDEDGNDDHVTQVFDGMVLGRAEGLVKELDLIFRIIDILNLTDKSHA